MAKNTGKKRSTGQSAARRDAPAATLMESPQFRVRVGTASAGPPPKIKSFAGRMKTLVRQHGGGVRAQRVRSQGGLGASAAAGLVVRSHPQRVIVKARVVRHAKYGSAADVGKALRKHTNYLARDGAAEDGSRGVALNAKGEVSSDELTQFRQELVNDRHHFRFIVSPENGAALDLPSFAKELVAAMETDLGTRLQWIGVAHYDTDEPHLHLLVRGVDRRGADLVIARQYLSHGLRLQAMEVATRHLGPRLAEDIERSIQRDLTADRGTGLDVGLAHQASLHPDGWVSALRTSDGSLGRETQRLNTLKRLQHLESLGLAREVGPGIWQPDIDLVARLRHLGSRGDILKLMHERLRGADASIATVIFNKENPPVTPVVGRVYGRGAIDDLSDRHYLLVEGMDGKAYYAPLSDHSEGTGHEAHVGSIVRLTASRPSSARPADTTIARLSAKTGIYDPVEHISTVDSARLPAGVTPDDYVASHVKRAQALASRGVLEPLDGDRFRVPTDLDAQVASMAAKGRDAGQILKVERLSSSDLKAQIGENGVTWLDRELARGVDPGVVPRVGASGFERQFSEAVGRRADQLKSWGLADVVDGRFRPQTRFLDNLYERELAAASEKLRSNYGEFVRWTPGQSLEGRLESLVQLPSGPHGLVTNANQFSLVPASPHLARQVGRDLMLSIGRGRSLASVEPEALKLAIRFRSVDLSPTRKLGLTR